VVQAYSREDYEDRQVRNVSRETVTAWLKTRRLSALLSPVVSLVIALCTGLVLWRGALLILAGTMTAGALTVFLAYLARFFQPVRALSQMTNTIAQASVGFQRVTAMCDADIVIPERRAPTDPPPFEGEIIFEHVRFGYDHHCRFSFSMSYFDPLISSDVTCRTRCHVAFVSYLCHFFSSVPSAANTLLP
jgi:ABC-type multidrug transport system fused ATPase/permease subunit